MEFFVDEWKMKETENKTRHTIERIEVFNGEEEINETTNVQ